MSDPKTPVAGTDDPPPFTGDIPPEPAFEFFVIDIPHGKIVPRLAVQRAMGGYAFFGGNRGGGPYSWETLCKRFHIGHTNGATITELAPVAPQPDDDEPVHGHFGLSYANYLVLHRTLMQSMPVDWQRRMVACLAELDDAFDHLELPASFIVEAAQEFEYGDLSAEQMKALGIEPEEDADGLPRFYYDRHGKEHERSDRVLVPLPGGDPIPLYDRGRARIAPNLAVKEQP